MMVVAAITTVTMAWTLSSAVTEAMEPIRAVWTTVKAMSCHFSWLRREQMKATMRPAAVRGGVRSVLSGCQQATGHGRCSERAVRTPGTAGEDDGVAASQEGGRILRDEEGLGLAGPEDVHAVVEHAADEADHDDHVEPSMQSQLTV